MYSTWYLSVLYFPTPLPTSLTSSPLLASPCSAQQLGSHDHIWMFLAKLDARPTSQKHPPQLAMDPESSKSLLSLQGDVWMPQNAPWRFPQNDRRIAPHHRSIEKKTCTLGDCDGERYACHWPQTGGIHPPLAEMMKKKLMLDVENHPVMLTTSILTTDFTRRGPSSGPVPPHYQTPIHSWQKHWLERL